MAASFDFHPDVQRLAELDALCFDPPWDKTDFQNLLANPHVSCWLLLTDGTPAGYIAFQTIGAEAELYRIGVLPEQRKAGWGGWMMKHWLGTLRENGVARVFLEVRVSNQAADALYRKSGFRVMATRKDYYQAPREDALIYERSLRDDPS